MNNVEDAKKMSEQIAPLIQEYEKKKSNRVSISRLIKVLKDQVALKKLSEDLKRAIIFEFRANGFLDHKETQDLWHSLIEKCVNFFKLLSNSFGSNVV